MHVGICGFPGSGKTTVFQALTPGAAAGRGGVVLGNIKVPDARIDRLGVIFKPKKKVFAETTFVDVQGAESAKVGGAFPPAVVQAMRNADALVQVVRCFENPMLTEFMDAAKEVRAFHEELVLLDLGIFEKRGERLKKEGKKGLELEVHARCQAHLEDNHALRSLSLSPDELKTLQGIQLLSIRPLITLFNLTEETIGKMPPGCENAPTPLQICGRLEAEIAGMPPAEQAEFLEGMGLGEPARNEFIRTAYRLLDLISFLTGGEDECRAWPIRRGSTARSAAGRIHSDIERGFIRAEVYRLEELEHYGTEAALKSAGKFRLEGKEYIVQDGDVINFRFNV